MGSLYRYIVGRRVNRPVREGKAYLSVFDLCAIKEHPDISIKILNSPVFKGELSGKNIASERFFRRNENPAVIIYTISAAAKSRKTGYLGDALFDVSAFTIKLNNISILMSIIGSYTCNSSLIKIGRICIFVFPGT